GKPATHCLAEQVARGAQALEPVCLHRGARFSLFEVSWFAGQRPVRPLPPNHDDHSGSRFGVDGRQMAAYRPTASTAGTGSVAKGIVASALVAKDFILFAGGGSTRARAAHDPSARHGQVVASARV